MQHKISVDLALSLDLESTGLYHEVNRPFLTQIALVPASITERRIMIENSFSILVRCPSLNTLKMDGNISSFVINHPKLNEIVQRASNKGVSIKEAGLLISAFIEKMQLLYGKPVILTKSVAGLDRRLLGETFGEEWLERNFHYQMQDLTSNLHLLRHLLNLQDISVSITQLENILGMKHAAHTATQDAVDSLKLYFKLLDTMTVKDPKKNETFYEDLKKITT